MNPSYNKTNQLETGNSKLSAGEFCYLAFLAIFSALKALGFYEGQTVFTLFMLAAFAFLAGKLALTRHTLLEYTGIVLLLFMGLLVYRNTGEKSLLINLAVLAGIKGVSGRRIFQTLFTVWGSCYTVLVFLALLGIHSDVLYMHNKHGIGYVLCHSLGYAHSNVVHINYLCICAMLLYLVKDTFSRRQKAALTVLLAVLDGYVFLYSMSFTGMLASLLFYVIYLYLTVRGKVGKVLKALFLMLVPALNLFFLAGPVLIKGRLFDLINKALNTRFNLTRWFLTEQRLTPFGTRFDIPNYRYTLDCSYAYLFIQLGVVPFLVLMLLYVLTIRWLFRNGRLTELAIMAGLCIAGGTEPFLFNLSFKNVTLIFVGEYLFDLSERLRERFCEKAGVGTPLMLPERVLLRGLSERSVPTCLCVCERGARVLSRIYRCWQRNWKRYLILGAVTFLAGVGTAAALRKPVPVVYINSSVNEEEERTPFYPEPEEVEDILESGGLVYGYPGPDGRMYPYYGSTAQIEYLRILVSSGVWCVGIVCVTAGAVQMRRQKR